MCFSNNAKEANEVKQTTAIISATSTVINLSTNFKVSYKHLLNKTTHTITYKHYVITSNFKCSCLFIKSLNAKLDTAIISIISVKILGNLKYVKW